MILFLFLFFNISLFAAAPTTHVYFSKLWMEKHPVVDEQKFMIGTLFPDIRYLGTLSREETHEKNVTKKLILDTKCSFTAGKFLHSYLDVKREKYIKKQKIKSHLSGIEKKLQVLFLKLLEDEILWDQRSWEDTLAALKVIYPEEIALGVDEKTVLLWHEKMSVCLVQRPSQYLKQLKNKGEGFLQADKEVVSEWCELLPLYAQEPFFINYTHSMIDYCINDIPKLININRL